MPHRLVARGLRLPPLERRLVLEAVASLAAARVILVALPFASAIARLGLQAQRSKEQPASPAANPDPMIAAIGLGIERARRIVPFRAVCLQQACAAALMLRRRGLPVEVHFGVTADGDTPLSAHAWSICRGDIVTGAAGADEFTPIAVFTS